MPIEKHNLIDEFPLHRERIHQLKLEDAQFAQQFAEYHDVDHEIRRIAQEIETPGDEYVENLKRRRVHLKDALFKQLEA